MNKYKINKELNTVIISLQNRLLETVSKTIIDLDDLDRVKEYVWCMRPDGYVFNFTVGRLHRFIINAKVGEEIDHINRIVLDNRKINLRIVTRSQNQINKDLHCNNTTGYKNIQWDVAREKWKVYIQREGKKLIQKRFDTIADAKEFRDYIIEEVYKENKVCEFK